MAYIVYNEDDKSMAGDPTFDSALTDIVDENPGYYIIDESTGEKVYG